MQTVRPIDCDPGSDIPSRDVVCWPSVPADRTAKAVSGATIRARDVSAERTLLARVSRIDEDDWDASQLRLVFDKGPELCESPVRHTCSLSASGRCPRTNTLEVLKSDRPSGALRLLHDVLRDAMVGVALEAGLSARDGAKLALGSSGLFSLEVAPAMGEDAPDFFDRLASMAVPVAVVSDVDDTHVDAEVVDGLDLRGLLDVAGDGDKEVAPLYLKVDLAFARDQHLSLVIAADEGDLDAPVQRPNGDDVVFAEAKNAIIEGLGGMWAKGVPVLLVAPVAGGDLGDALDDDLRSKTCRFADVAVSNFVDRKPREDLLLPGHLTDLAASGVGRSQRFQQGTPLLFSGQKLDGSDQFHNCHDNMALDSRQLWRR